MMNNEMLNGSGYPDPTASKAIENLIRGGKTMEYNDGDVIAYTNLSGAMKYGAILKCHEDYATIVQLYEKEPHENGKVVIARQMMYCDCGRPAYVYYSYVDDVIRTLSNDELNDLREAVRIALGISAPPATQPVAELVEREWTPPAVSQDMLYDLAAAVAEELKVTVEDAIADHDACVKAEAQRDVYKELFENERKAG